MTSLSNRQQRGEAPEMPLLQQYNKPDELSVSHVFKLRPEELSLLFRKDHIEAPVNQGEKRESLIILEKVGLVPGLLQRLGTEANTGVIGDKGDLTRRRSFFGENTKQLPHIKSYWEILVEQLEETTIRVLFGAGVISLLVGWFDEEPGSWVEGVSIMLACFFITMLSSLCNWGKEKQYLKIHDEIRNEKVSVIRGQYGLSQTSLVSKLVVGDIILIEAGMRVPADCVLIDGMDLVVDETMYGFGDSIPKQLSKDAENHLTNPDPFLLSRSLIKNGSGRAVVCAVGVHTRWFKENPVEDLEDDNEKTPLTVKLDLLANYIGNYSYAAGVVTFLILMVYLAMKIMISADEDDSILSNDTLRRMLRAFTTSITLIIVSVPEGLPLAVSLAMAFSVDYMKKDNLLVKKMASVEGLGTVKDICTGKTATLTENDMRVRSYFVGGSTYNFGASNSVGIDTLNETVRTTLIDCIIKNTEARVEMGDEKYYEAEGNGTEVAMLRFLQDNEVLVHEKLAERERVSEFECSIPFNPIRKRMCTVYRPFKGCSTVRIVVKGAPEYVLPLCNQKLTAEGEIIGLDEDDRQNILHEKIIGKFAKENGYRTFAYAYKDMDSDSWEYLQSQYNNFASEQDRYIIEEGLVFLAGFGLLDRLRKQVNVNVGNLKQANITVRMISGDNIETAKHAAKNANIITEAQMNDDDVCMTGEQFMAIMGGQGPQKAEINGKIVYKYGEEELVQFLDGPYKKIRVLARCTPEHKFNFIVALQSAGNEVAVTADGLNDVKALQQANVAFCMGQSGCEVAKDASDIIFLDDNFNSVFKATLWGRNILENIRKFVQFQLPINIVCVVIVILGAISFGNSPFSVIQLLWINLIMDTLAAISIATEPPSNKSENWGLEGSVRKSDDKIILPVMWRNVLLQCAYQLLVLVVLLYSAPWWFGEGYNLVSTEFDFTDPLSQNKIRHYTIVFNTFVLMNLFNMVASRKLGWADLKIFNEFFNNKWFLIVLAAELALQWAVVEYLHVIFRTESLDWRQHLTCWCFGLGALLVNLASKKMPEEQFKKYFEFEINETNDTAKYNKFMNVTQGLTAKIERSETKKLLESPSSV